MRRVRKRSRTDDQIEVAVAEMPDPPPAIKQWACASLRSQGVLDGVEAAVFKHHSPGKWRRKRGQEDGEGDSSDSDAWSRAETASDASDSDLESNREQSSLLCTSQDQLLIRYGSLRVDEDLLDQPGSRLEDTPSSPTPVRPSRRSRLASANKGDLHETPDVYQSNMLGAIDASSSLPRSSPVTEGSPAADTSPFSSSPSPSRAAEKRYEALLPPDPGYDQLFEDFGGDGGGGGGDDNGMDMDEDPFGEGVIRGLTAAARSQAWSSRIRSDCEDNLSALTSLASSRAVSPALEDLAAAPSSSSLTPRRDSRSKTTRPPAILRTSRRQLARRSRVRRTTKEEGRPRPWLGSQWAGNGGVGRARQPALSRRWNKMVATAVLPWIRVQHRSKESTASRRQRGSRLSRRLGTRASDPTTRTTCRL